jgi:hypothetical protein
LRIDECCAQLPGFFGGEASCQSRELGEPLPIALLDAGDILAVVAIVEPASLVALCVARIDCLRDRDGKQLRDATVQCREGALSTNRFLDSPARLRAVE